MEILSPAKLVDDVYAAGWNGNREAPTKNAVYDKIETLAPTARTLTVAGTANQITSSAGAQDLSANRTWTLSLPAAVTSQQFTASQTAGAVSVNKFVGIDTSSAAYLIMQNTNAPSGFRMGNQGNGVKQIGSLDNNGINFVANALNCFVIKPLGNICIGGNDTIGSGATRNLILSGSLADPTISPVLGAASTDNVAVAGVDNGAGNRELQVQPEAGKILAFGNNVLRIPAGNSTSFSKVGGAIANSFADVSVGGAEADIFSYTTPASVLNTNGDKITASYGGNFVTVGTELTQLKVYFAGTAIWDSTGVAPATGTTSWAVSVELIRVSSSVVRYTVRLNTTGASGYTYCVSGELTGLTLSNTNILKITGTSTGVGSGAGDIVGKMSQVRWESAA